MSKLERVVISRIWCNSIRRNWAWQSLHGNTQLTVRVCPFKSVSSGVLLWKMDSMRIAALGRQVHTGALYNYANDSIANVQPGTVCFIILLAERISFARSSFQILKLSKISKSWKRFIRTRLVFGHRNWWKSLLWKPVQAFRSGLWRHI